MAVAGGMARVLRGGLRAALLLALVCTALAAGPGQLAASEGDRCARVALLADVDSPSGDAGSPLIRDADGQPGRGTGRGCAALACPSRQHSPARGLGAAVREPAILSVTPTPPMPPATGARTPPPVASIKNTVLRC